MESYWTLYTNAVLMRELSSFDIDTPAAPPGSPPTIKYSGPWLRTQLVLSASIGIVSFLLFSYCRTRWPVLFAPRTKLKGFSPHDAHLHNTFFSWILPTIRTPELVILQIVGLDAAVLLTFFKMAFLLFSFTSIFALLVILPLNIYMHSDDGDPGDEPPSGGDDQLRMFFNGTNPNNPDKDPDWSDLINASNSFRAAQLLFTYIFTGLVLRSLYRNYRQFVRVRQLYSLELVHSIAARTVMVTDLPSHLQGERALAVYFENMGLAVESVNLVRHAETLNKLIDRRTEALLNLEWEWTKYVGNPSTVETYDPSQNVRVDHAPLIDLSDSNAMESQPARVVVPHRSRPLVRPGWFKRKVDALEYYQKEYEDLNEQVKKKRKAGRFKATSTAFVTFEKMSSAQIASQVVHAPHQAQSKTVLAPEPRDVVWSNMTFSPRNRQVRELIVMAIMVLLFFFWAVPVTTLAGFLSYKEIKKTLPWLAALIDKNATVQALVQNSLPSVAMTGLNAALPFLLEGLSYVQGLQARSWIEYFLFLLINVVFIFLLASTYWQLVRDLANSPAKIPTKLAAALSMGRARSFFMSYVILQALGVMPLQLLNLGIVIPRFIFIAFFTRTPRDFAELNAPPMINYGAVYPQAILVFVITIVYSVIQPQIMVFGALYFGIGYVVYKYKLLFVFYKPYESHGQAWPITFVRLIWGVVIFQVLMTGIFTLEQFFTLSAIMAPLIAFTIWWGWTTWHHFMGLSKFVSLSSVFEVQRGEDSDDVARLRAGAGTVSLSQSNLNRRRYAQNDETLYVAPEDERTDYSQPPMTNWYHGVLNTGKRRYGHPALTGVLPTPWLPLKKDQTLANYVDRDSAKASDGNTVVLTLRRRYSAVRKRGQAAFGLSSKNQPASESHADGTGTGGDSNAQTVAASSENLQPTTRQASHRLSFDPATGIITLPDGEVFFDRMENGNENESDSDYGEVSGETDTPDDRSGNASTNDQAAAEDQGTEPRTRRHSTYFHHPERRRQQVPGAFPA
ncbi:hypothetical protein PIIN_01215 [Serendipita indica DSM 11827]|uniref:DUF221-domain-containing protein n=1 Tax=Serendipita indica (strain DSM 11827) TaxID=1109443 RepID=G4T7W3_SERID|nr:hypothetical protein PIIN_01215 [Serendipita indica DSM 11827]